LIWSGRFANLNSVVSIILSAVWVWFRQEIMVTTPLLISGGVLIAVSKLVQQWV